MQSWNNLILVFLIVNEESPWKQNWELQAVTIYIVTSVKEGNPKSQHPTPLLIPMKSPRWVEVHKSDFVMFRPVLGSSSNFNGIVHSGSSNTQQTKNHQFWFLEQILKSKNCQFCYLKTLKELTVFMKETATSWWFAGRFFDFFIFLRPTVICQYKSFWIFWEPVGKWVLYSSW